MEVHSVPLKFVKATLKPGVSCPSCQHNCINNKWNAMGSLSHLKKRNKRDWFLYQFFKTWLQSNGCIGFIGLIGCIGFIGFIGFIGSIRFIGFKTIAFLSCDCFGSFWKHLIATSLPQSLKQIHEDADHSLRTSPTSYVNITKKNVTLRPNR